MARVTIDVDLPKLPRMNFNLTGEFKTAARIIVEEIRGNIKDGVDVHGFPLAKNAQSTITQKALGTAAERGVSGRFTSGPKKGQLKFAEGRFSKGRRLGQFSVGGVKPLIAFEHSLINKASYIITVIRKNFVQLTLTKKIHTDSSKSIAQIGKWNNDGTGRIPKREFWGVPDIAFKRVMSRIADRIKDILESRNFDTSDTNVPSETISVSDTVEIGGS